MKKLIASLLMGVLLLGGATTSFATGIETRGPVLDPVTKSGTKDCKAGTLRLFTLTHSARFTPDRLGSSCQVTNHKVGAKNLSSKLDADVYVQKILRIVDLLLLEKELEDIKIRFIQSHMN